MEGIGGADLDFLGRPRSRPTSTDCESRQPLDLVAPFPLSLADVLDFSSQPAASTHARILHDSDVFGFPHAQGSFSESYPARHLPWTASVSSASSEKQPFTFDDLDPFVVGNLEPSPQFQPLPARLTDSCSIVDPPVATDIPVPDHQSSSTRRRPRNNTHLRRQNHACDPCRSSKKRCNLPRGVMVRNGTAVNPCTSCEMRDLHCAVSWLASRQLVHHQDDRSSSTNNGSSGLRSGKAAQVVSARPQHTVVPRDVDTLTKISSLEGDLSRQVLADGTCSFQFGLYIDTSESYFFQCLVRGSMPLHFKYGITAYDNLSRNTHLSAHIEKVELWVASCGKVCPTNTIPPFVPGPSMFRAASLMDTLFSSSSPVSSRDAAITEAFRWVAIATSAQVNVGQSREGLEPGVNPSSYERDLALASWRKAKELIFTNLAATKSFRLALALSLFGNMVPPSGAAPHSQADADSEDRDFASCEGVRRLQELCKLARRSMLTQGARKNSSWTGLPNTTPFVKFPSEVCELVLELIGAFEWLACLSNSVAISVSCGRVCPFGVDVYDQEYHPLTLSSPPCDDGTAAGANGGSETLLPRRLHLEAMETPILRRARHGGVSFIDVWRSNIQDSETVLYAGRLPIALSTITWRILARFTMSATAVHAQSRHLNYEDVRRHYIAMMSHIDLWRTSFGTVDQRLVPKLRSSNRDIWRVVAFCSVDTDLAILCFCDTAQKLEADLEARPFFSNIDEGDLLGVLKSTKFYRARQKLTSASQTALVSSTCQSSTPSTTNLARESPSYGRYMCAHPNPWTLIQVHLLSMQTFAEELKQPAIHEDAERSSELAWGLDTCLRGLLELRESLHITPAIDLNSVT